MKIGDAVEDARLWEMLADHAAIFRGVRIPVQIDEIERQRLLPEHILDREIEGMVEALDAAALQFGRIRIEPRHVVARDERHLVAETLQREDVLEDALDPASLSGSGTESSITSARIRTLRSASNSGNSPLKRCVASVSFQRSKNLRWLIAWKRLTPLPVRLVPALAPSK